MTELSRRNLLKIAGAGALVTGFGTKVVFSDSQQASASSTTGVTADQALKQLMQGNQRYTAKKALHPNQTQVRLQEVAKGQHPVAVVLGCADSRVPPEIVFDQGLGDLFVIRVAGNIVDEGTLASIEFATAELGVPLVMVLGHERCGAVAATLKGEPLPGHISRLAQAIQPAVAQIKGKPGDPLDNAVRANVSMVAASLRASTPVLADLVKAGKLRVVGARYDLDTGAVELIA